jgi:hypothetical protein
VRCGDVCAVRRPSHPCLDLSLRISVHDLLERAQQSHLRVNIPSCVRADVSADRLGVMHTHPLIGCSCTERFVLGPTLSDRRYSRRGHRAHAAVEAPVVCKDLASNSPARPVVMRVAGAEHSAGHCSHCAHLGLRRARLRCSRACHRVGVSMSDGARCVCSNGHPCQLYGRRGSRHA